MIPCPKRLQNKINGQVGLVPKNNVLKTTQNRHLDLVVTLFRLKVLKGLNLQRGQNQVLILAYCPNQVLQQLISK